MTLRKSVLSKGVYNSFTLKAIFKNQSEQKVFSPKKNLKNFALATFAFLWKGRIFIRFFFSREKKGFRIHPYLYLLVI
ncbi:MAG: hypothetical protein A2007_05715 [Verrucomicrobia bacterium GWC2_42_7]|nr:MAG: hypothetical protein A2007_05715 [Verrucomicrobia bacterium GWC2_42_7]